MTTATSTRHLTAKDKATYLFRHPVFLAKQIGWKDLRENLHGIWLNTMLTSTDDVTIQAHRGAYKTTCLTLAIALLMIKERDKNIIFLRKTDGDVAEVVQGVLRVLQEPIVQQAFHALTGAALTVEKSNQGEITLSCYSAPRGSAQLQGIGIGGSLTGKHADIIITDDIINLKDRISRAERERTKAVYQELQNIRNRGGRIINTGTPWHKDDAFALMPEPQKWDYKATGLLTEQQVEMLRKSMAPSLFAANYELRHIPSDDVIFPNAQTGADISLVEQGTAHVDAAYYGEDYTALTVAARHDGKYYVYGRCWRKHVDECQAEIVRIYNELMVGKLYCERNGDKGYLAKQLRAQGVHTVCYDENQNKYIKITSHLKGAWENVVFVGGTDEQYIRQIEDFNENAEHDDCPDSLASLIRVLSRRREEDETYESLWALG